MDDFYQKFGIDLSNFDFTLHFLPEVGSGKNNEHGYYPVSIGHLIAVANKKSWFLPPKSEENYARAKKLAKKNQVMLLIVVTIISLIIVFGGQTDACA